MSFKFNIKSDDFTTYGRMFDYAKLNPRFNENSLSIITNEQSKQNYIYTYAMLNNVEKFNNEGFDETYYEQIASVDPLAASSYIGYMAFGDKDAETDKMWEDAREHYGLEYRKTQLTEGEKIGAAIAYYGGRAGTTILKMLDSFIGAFDWAYHVIKTQPKPGEVIMTDELGMREYFELWGSRMDVVNERLNDDRWFKFLTGWMGNDKTIDELDVELHKFAYYNTDLYNSIEDAFDGYSILDPASKGDVGDFILDALASIGKMYLTKIQPTGYPSLGSKLFWATTATGIIEDNRNIKDPVLMTVRMITQFAIEWFSEQTFSDSLIDSGLFNPKAALLGPGLNSVAYTLGAIGIDMTTNAIEEMIAEVGNMAVDFVLREFYGKTQDAAIFDALPETFRDGLGQVLTAGLSGALVGALGVIGELAKTKKIASVDAKGQTVHLSKTQSYQYQSIYNRVAELGDGFYHRNAAVNELQRLGLTDAEIATHETYRRATELDKENMALFNAGMEQVELVLRKYGYTEAEIVKNKTSVQEMFAYYKGLETNFYSNIVPYGSRKDNKDKESKVKSSPRKFNYFDTIEYYEKQFKERFGGKVTINVTVDSYIDDALALLAKRSGYAAIVVGDIGSIDGAKIESPLITINGEQYGGTVIPDGGEGDILYIDSSYYNKVGARSQILRQIIVNRVATSIVGNVAYELTTASDQADFYNVLSGVFKGNIVEGPIYFQKMVEKYGVEGARNRIIESFLSSPVAIRSLYVQNSRLSKKVLKSINETFKTLVNEFENVIKDPEGLKILNYFQAQHLNNVALGITADIETFDKKLAKDIRKIIKDTPLARRADVIAEFAENNYARILKESKDISVAFMRTLGFVEEVKVGEDIHLQVKESVSEFLSTLGFALKHAKNDATYTSFSDLSDAEMAISILLDGDLQYALTVEVPQFRNAFISFLQDFILMDGISDEHLKLARETLTKYIRSAFAEAPEAIKDSLKQSMLKMEKQLIKQGRITANGQVISAIESETGFMEGDAEIKGALANAWQSWNIPHKVMPSRALAQLKAFAPKLFGKMNNLGDVYTYLFKGKEMISPFVREMFFNDKVRYADGEFSVNMLDLMGLFGIAEDVINGKSGTNLLWFVSNIVNKGEHFTTQDFLSNTTFKFDMSDLTNHKISTAFLKSFGYALTKNAKGNTISLKITEVRNFMNNKYSKDVTKETSDRDAGNNYVRNVIDEVGYGKPVSLKTLFDTKAYTAGLVLTPAQRTDVLRALNSVNVQFENRREPGQGHVKAKFNADSNSIIVYANESIYKDTHVFNELMHEMTHAILSAQKMGGLEFSYLHALASQKGTKFNKLMDHVATLDVDGLLKIGRMNVSGINKVLKSLGIEGDASTQTADFVAFVKGITGLSLAFRTDSRFAGLFNKDAVVSNNGFADALYLVSQAELLARDATDIDSLARTLMPELSGDSKIIDLQRKVESLARRALDDKFDNRYVVFSQETDSGGNALSVAQVELFKRVSPELFDENGRLRVLFHGSRVLDIKRFSMYATRMVNAFFFTNDRTNASSYAGLSSETARIYEVHLEMYNPYVVDAKGAMWHEITNDIENTYTYGQLDDLYNRKKINVLDLTYILGDIADMTTRRIHNEKIVSIVKELGINADYSLPGDYIVESLSKDDLKTVTEEYYRQRDSMSGTSNSKTFLSDMFKKSSLYLSETTRDKIMGRTVNGEFYLGPYDTTNDIVARVIREGLYDGIIFKNIVDYGNIDVAVRADWKPHDVYIVFDPDRIHMVRDYDPHAASVARESFSRQIVREQLAQQELAKRATYDERVTRILDDKVAETNELIKHTSYSQEVDNHGNKIPTSVVEALRNSRVRDVLNKIIEVYHGSRTQGIIVFDPTKTDDGTMFFTNDYNNALSYTHTENPIVYRAYLNIKNPYIIDAKGTTWDMILDPAVKDVMPITYNDLDKLFNARKLDLRKILLFFMMINDNNLSPEHGDIIISLAKDHQLEPEENPFLPRIITNILSLNGTSNAKLQAMTEDYYDRVTKKGGLFGDSKTVFSDLLKQKGVYEKWRDGKIGTMRGDEIDWSSRDGLETTRQIVQRVLKEGIHDGIIINNVVDYGATNDAIDEDDRKPHDVYIVFKPEQVHFVRQEAVDQETVKRESYSRKIEFPLLESKQLYVITARNEAGTRSRGIIVLHPRKTPGAVKRIQGKIVEVDDLQRRISKNDVRTAIRVLDIMGVKNKVTQYRVHSGIAGVDAAYIQKLADGGYKALLDSVRDIKQTRFENEKDLNKHIVELRPLIDKVIKATENVEKYYKKWKKLREANLQVIKTKALVERHGVIEEQVKASEEKLSKLQKELTESPAAKRGKATIKVQEALGTIDALRKAREGGNITKHKNLALAIMETVIKNYYQIDRDGKPIEHIYGMEFTEQSDEVLGDVVRYFDDSDSDFGDWESALEDIYNEYFGGVDAETTAQRLAANQAMIKFLRFFRGKDKSTLYEYGTFTKNLMDDAYGDVTQYSDFVDEVDYMWKRLAWETKLLTRVQSAEEQVSTAINRNYKASDLSKILNNIIDDVARYFENNPKNAKGKYEYDFDKDIWNPLIKVLLNKGRIFTADGNLNFTGQMVESLVKEMVTKYGFKIDSIDDPTKFFQEQVRGEKKSILKEAKEREKQHRALIEARQQEKTAQEQEIRDAAAKIKIEEIKTDNTIAKNQRIGMVRFVEDYERITGKVLTQIEKHLLSSLFDYSTGAGISDFVGLTTDGKIQYMIMNTNIYDEWIKKNDPIVSKMSIEAWQELSNAIMELSYHGFVPDIARINFMNLAQYFFANKFNVSSRSADAKAIMKLGADINAIIGVWVSSSGTILAKQKQIKGYLTSIVDIDINYVHVVKMAFIQHIMQTENISQEEAAKRLNEESFSLTIGELNDIFNRVGDATKLKLHEFKALLRKSMEQDSTYQKIENDKSVLDVKRIDATLAELERAMMDGVLPDGSKISEEELKLSYQAMDALWKTAIEMRNYKAIEFMRALFNEKAQQLARGIDFSAKTLLGSKGDTPEERRKNQLVGLNALGRQFSAFRFMAMLSNPSVYIKNRYLNATNSFVQRRIIDPIGGWISRKYYEKWQATGKLKTQNDNYYIRDINGNYYNLTLNDSGTAFASIEKVDHHTKAHVISRTLLESYEKVAKFDELGLSGQAAYLQYFTTLNRDETVSQEAKDFVKVHLIDNGFLKHLQESSSNVYFRSLSPEAFDKYLDRTNPFVGKSLTQRALYKAYNLLYNALEGEDFKTMRKNIEHTVTVMVENLKLYKGDIKYETEVVDGKTIERPVLGQQLAQEMDRISQVAFEKALEVVFKSPNKLHDLIKKFSKSHPLASFVQQALIPFPRVATNIFSQIIKYSPLGFIDITKRMLLGRDANTAIDQNFLTRLLGPAVAKTIPDYGSGGVPMDTAFFDRLGSDMAKASVGTAFFILGSILSALGLVGIRLEKDPVNDYRGYVMAVDIMGETYHVDISSALPTAMAYPLLLGAAFNNVDKKFDLGSTFEQFVNLTFLGNLLDSTRSYKIENIIPDMVEDYLVSFSPSILRTVYKSLFNRTQIQYPSGGLKTSWLQRVYERSVPYLSPRLWRQDKGAKADPYTGEKLMNYTNDPQGIILNILNVFTPIAVQQYIHSDVQRISEQYGVKMTTSYNTTLSFDGKEGNLTDTQRNLYNQERGRAYNYLVRKTVKTSTWRNASAEERTKILKGLGTSASTMAKASMWLANNNKNYYNYTSDAAINKVMKEYLKNPRFRKVGKLREEGVNYYGQWL